MTDVHSTADPLPKALSLKGRRALVTGAANGIGRAAALCLADLGADLVLADQASLTPIKEEIEARGRAASVLQGDLNDDAFLDEIIAGGPYYSFAYVAGVFRGPPGASRREAFNFVMSVNVHAGLVLGDAFLENPHPDGGYMVFVGSSAGRSGKGRLGEPVEYATYASSKGAVHSLVRALASRGAEKNILVNGVAPGVVRTPMLSLTAAHMVNNEAASTLGRSADPLELGWPIALLCSPAASFISGAVLDVNGGLFVG